MPGPILALGTVASEEETISFGCSFQSAGGDRCLSNKPASECCITNRGRNFEGKKQVSVSL